jgi:hypothetical protein
MASIPPSYYHASAAIPIANHSDFFNISNDVGPVKELLLLDLAVSRTPFPSAQTHWLLSRE